MMQSSTHLLSLDIHPPPSHCGTLYNISKVGEALFEMSTVVPQAEASKPQQQQKRCKNVLNAKQQGFRTNL